MTRRSAWYAILACSTALAGTPALAQAAPGPQQLPGAQPGTIAGSAQGDETATDTSAATGNDRKLPAARPTAARSTSQQKITVRPRTKFGPKPLSR